MPNRLGLAKKASKLTVGTDQVIKAIQSGKAKLVFLASDAAFNTTKKIIDKCHFYQVEVLTMFDSNTLSKAIGRSNIKCVAILDEGFRDMFKN